MYAYRLMPREAYSRRQRSSGLDVSPSLEEIPIDDPVVVALRTLPELAILDSATAVVQGVSADSVAAAQEKAVTPHSGLKTYYRRRQRIGKRGGVGVAPPLDSQPELASVVDMAMPADVVVAAVAPLPTSLPPATRAAFFDKITTKTASVLPTPIFPRSKLQGRTPSAPPRRSRRLAGIDAEFSVKPEPEAGRYKRRVMRTLEVIQEQEGIVDSALENYAKLFSQPLSDTHFFALACLFRWRTPDELVEGNSNALLDI